MNITCYECGQAGHIWTNCPRLMKVRTVAVRADGTENPEMDPQEDDEVLPPDQEGEGDNSEHQEEQLNVHMEPQYQWDTEEEEETDDNAVSYRCTLELNNSVSNKRVQQLYSQNQSQEMIDQAERQASSVRKNQCNQDCIGHRKAGDSQNNGCANKCNSFK